MTVLASNRDAYHEYEILEKLTAGVALYGSEVKAAREGKVDFAGSFVKVIAGKLELINMYVGSYSKDGKLPNPENERRTRHVLVHKKELERLEAKVKEKGFTLVPLQLHTAHGLIKLEIGLGRGKKKVDKKEDLKKKQAEKELKLKEKEVRRYGE